MGRSTSAALISFLAILVASVALADDSAGIAALDDCDARVRNSPHDPLSYYCYLQAVRGGAPVDAAVRRLEGILAVTPQLHRARMILGMIEDGQGSPRTERLLSEALDGMETNGDHHGVVYGGLTLANRLGREGRLDEAEIVIVRAARAADASGDTTLRANVTVERGMLARRHADYGRSLRLYREAEAAVFPGGPAWLQGNVLSGIGWIQWYFSDLRKAMETYRRESEIHRASGNRFGEASPRINLAYLAVALADRGEFPREDCLPLVEEALGAAIDSGNASNEARARLLLARLLSGPAAAEECHRSIRLAQRAGDAPLRWSAMRYLALVLIDLDAENATEAFALIDSTEQEAREAGMPTQVAYSLEKRADLSIRAGSRGEALSALETCLDAVEAIGKLQVEDSVRVFALSQWSRPYHRMIGILLEGLATSSDPAADLEQAFRTMERRHARSLTEILGNDGRSTDGAGGDPYPTLEQVRAELDDDEMMLVYEVIPENEGRSWLLAITRGTVEVRELPGSAPLGDAVAVFEGLLRTDDPLAARAASDLHELIFDDVLDGIGDRLRTVFVIPDGPLHELPFAALRDREDSEPLGAQVRIDEVPSASLWLRWRTTPPADTPGGVLALADPEISLTGAVEAFRGAEPWSEGQESAALPRARGEARVVARSVGGDSRVLVGSEASEGALKASDLKHYRVLHLAAHAVVDDSLPERSAVLLAPGSNGEDGLLQVNEIAALNLEGQIVILSACRGASGLRVEGEGVLGLSRAFLAAGARAVLANRWPYRDDHAAMLTAAIAREIGRGTSIGDALTLARRARVAAGAPAGAWAGVTLIGDGGMTPVPGGRWPRGWIIPTALIALAALLAGLAWRDARRRVR
jgi:hypothetical protein